MRIHSKIISNNGFTLIELLVGMTIFAVGMTAILVMYHAAISTSMRSREEIIAANLLRERIELWKNIRNTNVRSYAPWDQILISGSNDSRFGSGIFLIENNYREPITKFRDGKILMQPILVKDAPFDDVSVLPDDGKYEGSRLYLDQRGRYTHVSTGNTPTNYAAYIIVSPIDFEGVGGSRIAPKDSVGRPQGFILDARVIARTKGDSRMYDLKTVITDWQK